MSIETISPDTAVGNPHAHSARTLPPIVRIVLTQAALHRMQGAITQATFEAQLQRLSRENLEPRGLSLVMRELACGSMRFIVKAESTGQVFDMIEITPEREVHPA